MDTRPPRNEPIHFRPLATPCPKLNDPLHWT
jgi:hypothetical protein